MMSEFGHHLKTRPHNTLTTARESPQVPKSLNIPGLPRNPGMKPGSRGVLNPKTEHQPDGTVPRGKQRCGLRRLISLLPCFLPERDNANVEEFAIKLCRVQHFLYFLRTYQSHA